jgi:UDP-glucose 4-epimerase
MNVLLVGCNGFIGSHLAQRFMDLGYHVTGCDLGASSWVQIQAYFQVSDIQLHQNASMWARQYDICINASGSGEVARSLKTPLLDFELNCTLTLNVLEAIKMSQRKCKHVYFSSAAVYGESYDQRSVLSPVSPYGWNKRIGELLCEQYQSLFGIESLAVRPFSVYGPGLRKQLFWEMAKKMTSDGKIQAFGTGEELRDYVYVDDVVDAIVWLLNKPWKGVGIIDIGTGVPTRIKDVVEMVAKHYLRTKNEVEFTGTGMPGSPNCLVASQVPELLCDFQFKTSLVEGVERTINWIKTIDD